MTLWLQPIQDNIHSHTSIITLRNSVGAGHASDVKTRLNVSLTILSFYLMHNITVSILYKILEVLDTIEAFYSISIIR